MDWKLFSLPLLAAHSGKPQEMANLREGLLSIEHGMGALARLGHVYHLAPGPGVLPEPWPRLLFHIHLAPNGRVIRDEEELRNSGPGWYDTMEDAQHANGR